jgi:MFS family permease
MTFRSMHRQVLLLASAQALFQTASVLVMRVGGLAGGMLAPSPDLATLPIAAMFLGTAAATFPASMWMARVGRRVGFVVGAMVGTAGGLLAAAGIWMDLFPLLVLGTCLVGAHQAFAQFYRFAASEVADDDFRPRAISWVLGGGIVAAFAGPTLGRIGSHLLSRDYAGSFLLLAAVTAVGAAVLAAPQIPKPSPLANLEASGRPWRAIVSQKEYLVALFGAATGYGIMILAMTATPIAMMQHHHELSSAAGVIQFHVLGMFLPSFFTGSLIARFGALRIMGIGVLLFAGHVSMTLTGFGFTSFAGALALLGVGWNFLYIGGTTLLTTTYTPAEKGRAQATNDMTIFAVGLACSFSAGGLLQALGWQTLNLLLLPWLALAMVALLWLGLRQRRPVEPAAASL